MSLVEISESGSLAQSTLPLSSSVMGEVFEERRIVQNRDQPIVAYQRLPGSQGAESKVYGRGNFGRAQLSKLTLDEITQGSAQTAIARGQSAISLMRSNNSITPADRPTGRANRGRAQLPSLIIDDPSTVFGPTAVRVGRAAPTREPERSTVPVPSRDGPEIAPVGRAAPRVGRAAPIRQPESPAVRVPSNYGPEIAPVGRAAPRVGRAAPIRQPESPAVRVPSNYGPEIAPVGRAAPRVGRAAPIRQPERVEAPRTPLQDSPAGPAVLGRVGRAASRRAESDRSEAPAGQFIESEQDSISAAARGIEKYIQTDNSSELPELMRQAIRATAKAHPEFPWTRVLETAGQSIERQLPGPAELTFFKADDGGLMMEISGTGRLIQVFRPR